MKPLVHPRTAAALEAVTTDASASLIFHGAPSSGKRLAAEWLAARLNCAAGGGDNCAICRQIGSGNYPDYIVLAPEDKASVTIEQIRRLLTQLALATYHANGIRLVVIDAAESLTPEAQNALLKSLEEPPARTRFILITSSLEALLPTVRSRLGTIFFAPVGHDELATFLERQHGQTPATATRLAELADGAVGEAVNLTSTPAAGEARTRLEQAVENLLAPARFTRLVEVRSLIDDKASANDLVRLIQRRVTAAAIEGADIVTASKRLAALVAARKLLSAGVTPRVVLDRLGVEL